MIIAGLQKLTLLDYPGRLAATIFTPGCDLRCPFCHNAPLVEEEGQTILSDGSNITGCINESELTAFLKGRLGRLTGVAITGGEPLMQDGIAHFIAGIKDLGYGVKLDTNGTYPEKLQLLIDKGLVDYVAMDVKNSWEHYPETIGLEADKAAPLIEKCKKSMDILKNSGIDFEFRTTVVRELHTESDIAEIAKAVGPVKNFFLQKFTDSGAILRTGYSSHSDETLKEFAAIAKQYSPNVQLRGVD